jgi:mannosyltransferase
MKIINWFKNNYILAIILLIAFILRIYHIDFQSVWLDEIHTLNEANPQKSFTEVYESLLIAEPHPPLYFYVIHILFKIFGYTTFVARVFSALLGLAGVFSIYLLGKELYNKKVGIYAAILITINYFQIYYSQDARMYALLFLTTTLSFVYLIKFIKSPSFRSAIIFSIMSSIMIYSHFFAIFVLVSQYLILLYFIIKPFQVRRKQFFVYTFISGIITVFLYLPTYGLILKTTEMTSIWIQMPGLDVYTQFFKDFFGQSELVIFFVVILVILYFIQLFRQKNTQNLSINPNKDKFVFSFFVLFIWLLVTLLLPLIRTYTSLPMLVNRYFISILPAIIIIIAIGLYNIKNEIVRYSILLIIVIASITDIVIVKKYYDVPNKTQFREVSRFILDNNISNDPVVTSLSWYFPYFLNNDNVKTNIVDGALDNYVNEMINDSTKVKSFWYVDAHSRPFKIDDRTQKFLDDHFYLENNIDLYDTWTKHYIKSSNRLMEIDISMYKPLENINGDKINFWIDEFNVTEESISVLGWAYLDGQDATKSIIELFLLKEDKALKLPSQKVQRDDITKFVNGEYNLGNSGFSTKINFNKLESGTYRLGLSITNKETKKSGLVLSDRIFSKK